jgi:hypothetical protein
VTWVRPGPPAILPRSAPGGVVVHVYAVPSGRLLVVQSIEAGTYSDKLPEQAAEQAWSLLEAVEPGADGVCLVAYDGDSGERGPWPT